jgi:quercetin dioxygenase-like cupin family protein
MPLEHSRPEGEARFAVEGLHVLVLEARARELRQEPEYERNARNGTTLVKTPRLRQVPSALRAGARLEEHTAPGPLSVLLLDGELRFEAGAEGVQLQPGGLLSLPSERPHRVEALRDSTFLLTIEMEEPHSGVVLGEKFHERG